MKVAHLIGRILLGGFLVFGSIMNLVQFKATVAFAQAYGVPYPQFLSLVAMLLLLAGGTSILTGFQPRVGIVVMMVFLIPVTLMMHQFWKIQDPMQSLIQEKFFMENIGLLGSMLMFLAIPTPWPFSLGQPASQETQSMVPEPE